MTRRSLVALAIAFAIALAASPAGAQQPAARDPRIDRIFAAYAHGDTPGCAVGVVRDGRWAFRGGYGMADLDHDIPNGPGMVYYVGSVSKQFTAAAIGLLALDGRLSLDDDVRKWIPELPDYARTYGTPLTIRHLVHHTGGVRDIYALMGLRGDRMEDVLPDSEALALIARQKGLGFAPGTRYSYSNSGYFLLAQVVKRASGQSLREFAQARIFAPLGMTRTHFHDDGMHVLKGRAFSYAKDTAGTWRLAWLQNFDKTGAGGLWTTIDDLQKWDANYYSHEVGGDALQAMIHGRGVLSTGDTLPYAFGNTVGTHRGLRVVQHTGSLMGYQAYIGRFPDQRLSVILTCNAEDAPTERLGLAVAELYLGDRMQPADTRASRAPVAAAPRPTEAATPAGAAVDTALVGEYESEELGVRYRVQRLADGRLAVSWPRRAPVPLVPVQETPGSYRMGGLGVRFERTGTEAAPTLVLTVPRAGEMRMTRVMEERGR
jgi:CubicO group peptidase (beta-lactamase class C family)